MRFAGPLIWASLMTLAVAEPVPSFVSPSTPPHGVAVYTRRPPAMQSGMDEKEWADAPPLFFPEAQGKIEAASQASCEVRFLWTEEGVYVAFRTIETTPAFGHIKPGEPLYQEDSFELFIDQIGDHRQYYEIQANPAGQTYFKNYFLTAPPRLTPEKRLTPEFVDSEFWRYEIPTPEGFQIASQLNSATHKWSLEMFLPKSFVNRRRGGQSMEPCTWRVNLVRQDWNLPKDEPGRTVKFMYWAPVLPGHPHESPEAMGYLYLKKP